MVLLELSIVSSKELTIGVVVPIIPTSWPSAERSAIWSIPHIFLIMGWSVVLFNSRHFVYQTNQAI